MEFCGCLSCIASSGVSEPSGAGQALSYELACTPKGRVGPWRSRPKLQQDRVALPAFSSRISSFRLATCVAFLSYEPRPPFWQRFSSRPCLACLLWLTLHLNYLRLPRDLQALASMCPSLTDPFYSQLARQIFRILA